MALIDTTPGARSEIPIVWVRPNSNVQAVASVLSSSIVDEDRITLRAIGAGAVNQAIKATVQARQTLAGGGHDMAIRPGMVTVEGNDGLPVTAVVLHCYLT